MRNGRHERDDVVELGDVAEQWRALEIGAPASARDRSRKIEHDMRMPRVTAIVAEILLLRHHVAHCAGARGSDLAGFDASLNAVAYSTLSRSGQDPFRSFEVRREYRMDR